jgi:hypothetical protein
MLGTDGLLLLPGLRHKPSWAKGQITSSHNRDKEVEKALAVLYRVHTGDRVLIVSSVSHCRLTRSSVMLFQKCSIFLALLYGVQMSMTPR